MSPRLFYGAPPGDLCSRSRGSPNPGWPSGTHLQNRKKHSENGTQCGRHLKGSTKNLKICALWNGGPLYRGSKTFGRPELPFCRCQLPDRITEMGSDAKNGTFFREAGSKNMYMDGVNLKDVIGLEELRRPENGEEEDSARDGLASRPTQHKERGGQTVEDEAWNLLKESVVYYCGNPVGTIAANDPSDATVLNYDQVFIRDFIPSGVAFLLKGEYDIVRNFILHTLQLQVTPSFPF